MTCYAPGCDCKWDRGEPYIRQYGDKSCRCRGHVHKNEKTCICKKCGNEHEVD